MDGRSITFPDQANNGRENDSLAARRGIGDLHKVKVTPFLSIGVVTLLSLICLTVAEIVTVFVDPGWGSLCHAALAGATLALAAIAANKSATEGLLLDSPSRLEARLLVALALPPILRLVTLAMPRDEFSQSASGGVVTLCLLGAIWAAMRANDYNWREAGLVIPWSRRSICLDLLVASSGVILGYVEYRTWRPEGRIDELALNRIVITTLLVLAAAGLSEELMLRGVIQVAGIALFGSAAGITLVAAVFAIMHIGYRSWQDVTLAFAVAVWLGLAVRITGSLVGASFAHGIANVCLFVAFPLLLQ